MIRFALAVFTLALPLAAQQGILGNVTDATGAAVPGAAIRILNTGTGAMIPTSTK
jgi:hypothetical protein